MYMMVVISQSPQMSPAGLCFLIKKAASTCWGIISVFLRHIILGYFCLLRLRCRKVGSPEQTGVNLHCDFICVPAKGGDRILSS